MHYTSFNLAERLKENGFPQPVPAFGQVWYLPILPLKKGPPNAISVDDAWGKEISRHKALWTFAPYAHDILQELPADLFLRFRQDYGDGIKYFYLESIAGGIHAGGPNAAEVCAVEYLKIRLAGIPILAP